MYNEEEFKEKVIKLYRDIFRVIHESFGEIQEEESKIIFNSLSNLIGKIIVAGINEDEECFFQRRLNLAKEFNDSICEIILHETLRKNENEAV